jgi:hypothetical protein
MSNVTIKYGDHTFYSEAAYDDVCKAITDGVSLDVFRLYPIHHEVAPARVNERITFFSDPDWVAVELP